MPSGNRQKLEDEYDELLGKQMTLKPSNMLKLFTQI